MNRTISVLHIGGLRIRAININGPQKETLRVSDSNQYYMSATERRLSLIFTGRNESGQAVKSVTQSLRELKQGVREGRGDIESLNRAYRDSQTVLRAQQSEERNLRMEFRQTHESFFRATDTIQKVGSAGTRIMNFFTAYNALQIRITEQNEAVAESFERMNNALRKYGANSDQAKTAIKSYNNELEQQKRLNSELPAQYAAQALSLTGIASEVGQLTLMAGTLRRQGLLNAGRGAADFSGAINDAALLAAAGSGGLRGRLGSLAGNRFVRGAAFAAGPAILAANEIRRSQGEDVDFGSKLAQIGGMAAMGAAIGTVVPGMGNVVGAAGGAGVGFVTSFREELANAIQGQGFRSDAQVEADKASGIQIGTVIIQTNSVQNAADLKAELEAEADRYR